MESNLNSDSKYININEFAMNWYFNDEEIRVSSEDMKHIKTLTTAFSGRLWEKYISNRNHHFMLLDNDDKLSQLVKADYNWLNDWNNGIYENFRNYLLRSVMYKQHDTIFVFWSKKCAVETTWSIFIKHWTNFLFDDEGVIVINTSSESVLVFCSDGILLNGKRILNL